MHKARKYGNHPFNVAVIHGGPGAAGEMAPVCRELAESRGVIEPLQSAVSVNGQIRELADTLRREKAAVPITLIGFSWGAWLSFLFTAKYPRRIKKLILIGSGPFQERYALDIQKTRLSRLSDEQKNEFRSLGELLSAPGHGPAVKERLSALFLKTDAYSPLQNNPADVDFRPEVFRGVWPEAALMRRTGKLLASGKNIQCPVVAIHGDYDPHPASGVDKPLSALLPQFRFILLKQCGHKPWIEQKARKKFYDILSREVL
ncbi:MAG: alpha/beta hydrolase [Candidatus Omnitrophica bacterium]|nr:alpha/beta hydrolase [Candidatus Omnitrophota bacterium]